MSFFERLRPCFWAEDTSRGLYQPLFNYRRLWKQATVISTIIVLLPLLLFTFYEYNVTEEAFEAEALARSARYVSKTRRTVSFLMQKKIFALEFIANDNSYGELIRAGRLQEVMEHLNKGLGLFVDLGVIDASGRQQAYAGSYKLEDADYSGQQWFREIQDQGVYVSDVFMGLRQLPHIVIAIKKNLDDGFYVLRTSVSIDRFNEILSGQQVEYSGDAFLVNSTGQLQTPSRFFGSILGHMPLPVPEPSVRTETYLADGKELGNTDTGPLVVSYAYVDDSPYILMLVNRKDDLMGQWKTTRTKIIVFLVVTITIILFVILWLVSYLVSVTYISDQKRVMALHEIEYSEKMASVGRLAAGIAHEINNPLAIINEKAGFIQDLFTLKKEYQHDDRLMGLVDSIVSSVERCAVITRRLLNFSRQTDGEPTVIRLTPLVQEVLSFLGKEPEYRSIAIKVDIAEDIGEFVSDRVKLQQVLLNIIKNAFAAVEDGGRLEVIGKKEGDGTVSLSISDNGCGIPQEDINKIFEPFFTTRSGRGGTGLGLAITYNLVNELGGTISVASKQGEGTCFTLTFPLSGATERSKSHESTVG